MDRLVFTSFVTVRCGETDALGHINNTSYFIYLEEARIKFFQELGYKMDIKDWRFILASTKCDYLKQGYFNQTLKITTEVSRIGTKSFDIQHNFINEENDEQIAYGEAVIVYFNFETQKSERLPDRLIAELSKYLINSGN
jgi:acyl-CoA thioester hydrolase